MPSPVTATFILSLLTVVGDILVVLLFLLTLLETLGAMARPSFLALLDHYGLLLLFLIPLTAMSGSLFFSEVAGFVPCTLCWYQRIFMYAQVPVAFVALLRRDRGIAWSILALCLIGMTFSVTQYVEQVTAFLAPALTGICGDPAAGPCAATQIFTFGYITIPMMALTAFAMNALVALRVIRKVSYQVEVR